MSRDLELGGSLRLVLPHKSFPISMKFGMYTVNHKNVTFYFWL